MSGSPPRCSSFDRWAAARVGIEWCHDHLERWHAFARTRSPEAFAAARRRATRAAALLGALPDGLAFEDRALTEAVARQEPRWRSRLEARRAGLGTAFARQLDTYQLVELHAVAGTSPDEELIKLFHEHVCRSQATYLVSEGGRLARTELPRGRYKSKANHPPPCGIGHDPYVEAGAVDEAMRQLVAELAHDAFASAHPAVQTAYALHSLLAIHPFADGNGRVARALASIYLLRALSLPFFVEASDRRPYLDALRRADAGDVQPLVGFVARRGRETISFALHDTADARSRPA
ncbi:MAG TPA: Fic family protein [Acidimicrobiia bacterium]|nr:Fic family protein [Acidimicrobiia bacterium]